METKQKYDWNAFFERIEKRGYEILSVFNCPNCGGKACEIHSIGVCHSQCENDDYSNTGFGGPTVRSWGAAVAWGNVPFEEQKKIMAEKKRKLDEKQQQYKDWLLSED